MSQLTNAKSRAVKYIFSAIGILVFTLFSFSSHSQSSAQSNSAKGDQIQDYIEKNKETPLVKYYLHDKNDKIAVKAMRYSVVLSDENTTARLKEEDVTRFKKELDEMMVIINRIDALVQSGKSYEEAKETVQK